MILDTEAHGTIPWSKISTVLLDMDGVLLDRGFDDWFFNEAVPEAFADQHHLTLDQAKKRVYRAYQQNQGELAWYDLIQWSKRLEVDILALTHQYRDRIRPRPQALDFLSILRKTELTVVLVTNADPPSLALKLKQTGIQPYFDYLLSSQTLGAAKESPDFWVALDLFFHKNGEEFKAEEAVMVEDTELILHASKAAGIGHQLHISTPCIGQKHKSSQDFPSIKNFSKEINALKELTPKR
ncbi:HAD family hydrolase [Magnetococcales bacterium HHB-1]